MTMSMATPTIDPDTLSMPAIREGALRERPVAVLGFARSGVALARFRGDPRAGRCRHPDTGWCVSEVTPAEIRSGPEP